MTTRQHVLIVEDEAHLATGIKYNLAAEGYRATVVGDGPSALRFIEGHPDDVDLVILDLMLPGMSGYAVCKTLRADEKQMPILILSARALVEDRTRAFDVGADQYLTKPFDLDEFLSRVRNLLALWSRRAGRQSKRSTPIRSFAFDDAEINFETFQVTVRGKPVRMTRMEMKLLWYFVQNEGRVIPRRELLENVWDLPGYLNTRAPDQLIWRLRKAFEPDPARPQHFLTIRDTGYRFAAAGGES
ncbi:MAG: response regulator transcription factor [Planctomycetota bacterium]|jgi:two-component system OmpR family response regulator